MSRYMVNKAMWEIDMSNAKLAAFKADRSRFLDSWEAAAREPEPPYPFGGTLTAEERRALETLDFAALYSMGTNPYVLWQFARSVSVPELASNEQLMAEFREAVTPHGYPDFAT
jgi:hypothetical protein